jgi:hypothetical protein
LVQLLFGEMPKMPLKTSVFRAVYAVSHPVLTLDRAFFFVKVSVFLNIGRDAAELKIKPGKLHKSEPIIIL